MHFIILLTFLIGLFSLTPCMATNAVEITADEIDLGNIGMLKAENSNGENSQCTATPVASNLIITAAHCLFDREENLFESVHFYPNFNQKSQYVERINIIHMTYLEKKDVALLALETSLTDFFPLSESTQRESEISIVGYPALEKQRAWISSCEVEKNTSGIFTYNCPTAPGMSGAPILTNIDGEISIIGIHLGKNLQDGKSIGLSNLVVILDDMIKFSSFF